MHAPLLKSDYRPASRITLLLACLGTALLGTFQSSASSGTENTMVVRIVNGESIPVQRVSALPKKQSGETLYLSSAVSLKPCSLKPAPTPTPKPIPTPKPAPTPKPTPTPKATPTPAPHQAKVQTPSKPQPVATGKDITSRTASASITVIKDGGKNVIRAGKGKPAADEDDDLDDYRQTNLIADPIEPVNRGIFWFNHQLYHYAFHPLGRAYKTVFPSPVRTGIYNVFDNLEFPIRFVNDLLQWQPKRAGLETEKFVINSTAGVGGIFRPSNKVPWLKDVPKTDTGVTLAKWGVPHGCYIVWPVLGPKSLRDSAGFVGDLAMYPVTWVTYGAVGGLSGATTLAVSGPDAARTTSDKIDTYDTLTRTSIDRYLSVRSAYEQNRKKAEGK